MFMGIGESEGRGQPAGVSGDLLLFLAGGDVVQHLLAARRDEPMQDILSLIRVSMTPRFFMSVSRWTDKFATKAGALAKGSEIAVEQTFFGQGTQNFDIVVGQGFSVPA